MIDVATGRQYRFDVWEVYGHHALWGQNMTAHVLQAHLGETSALRQLAVHDSVEMRTASGTLVCVRRTA